MELLPPNLQQEPSAEVRIANEPQISTEEDFMKGIFKDKIQQRKQKLIESFKLKRRQIDSFIKENFGDVNYTLELDPKYIVKLEIPFLKLRFGSDVALEQRAKIVKALENKYKVKVTYNGN